jgi:hypothetical protein
VELALPAGTYQLLVVPATRVKVGEKLDLSNARPITIEASKRAKEVVVKEPAPPR